MSDHQRVREYAWEILDSETGDLPNHAFYHSKEHTRNVYDRAVYLGREEGLSEEDMEVLVPAALLHDIGHVKSVEEHEEIGAKIAGKVLPQFGYNEGQISRVQDIILSTKVDLAGDGQLHVNPPENKTQEIICDADLDNLGRDDFYDRSEDLREELAGRGIELSRSEHYANTLSLMKRHEYFTDTQIEERRGQKHEWQEEIESNLESGNIDSLVERRLEN